MMFFPISRAVAVKSWQQINTKVGKNHRSKPNNGK